MMGGLMDDGETIKQVKVEAGGASFFCFVFCVCLEVGFFFFPHFSLSLRLQ
jgi:hypothetical protein